jgi:hypothetical protein
MTAIAERAPDCGTVTTDHFGVGIDLVFDRPLDRPYTSHPLT